MNLKFQTHDVLELDPSWLTIIDRYYIHSGTETRKFFGKFEELGNVMDQVSQENKVGNLSYLGGSHIQITVFRYR